MDVATIILIILVILIIVFLIAVVALYFTGRIGVMGPTGPAGIGSVGPTGSQGISGLATNTGATGSRGDSSIADFAFVSFSQSFSDSILEVPSGGAMPFNHTFVHGSISMANPFTVNLASPGYYQVAFGYGNVMPATFAPQSFSLMVSNAGPIAQFTLQEQVNLTTSPTLRYDRGGQSATAIVQTTIPNQTLTLVNTLNTSISFLNETSAVSINNVGSLSAYMSIIRLA
jgi:hypothetical protein